MEQLNEEPNMEDSLAETTRKQGNNMNVSSIIMYKIPTSSLGDLRDRFEKSGIGLDLIEFLSVMVQTMDLNNQNELLHIIPDLVDFFKSVDINGDGRMEWSEFVMFVIESVVVTDPNINEQMFNVSHSLLQSAASRHGVKASKVLPEFSRLFVGLGPSVLIFEPDHHEETWIDKGMQLKLASKVEEESNEEKDKPMQRTPKDDRMDKALKCLDFVYLGAREMLLVLRSDMALEFHRFMARNKVHPDLIQQNGMWHFEQPYDKIQLRQMSWSRTKPKIPWKLFAMSESRRSVDTWTITVGITGIVSLIEHEEISTHTDFVKDILVINNELLHYNYFVSCGMDKKVHLYDLATLKHKAIRTGHAAGVQCLAYDNRSLLMAGGFDYKIIAWDLDAEIDRPIFQLWGHGAPITKIVAIGSVDRTASLDTAGILRFWDSSKSNPNDKEARQIDMLSYVDDTLREFDIFTGVSSNFGTAHSIIIAAQGRKQHLYRIEDMTPKESAPLQCGGVLFTYSLLMMITVHSHDVLLFSASSGEEQKKMDRSMLNLQDDLGNEVMSACLDDRERKLIIGEASGNISVYNILSGVRLKCTARDIPFGVRELIYSPDKTIISVAGPGELYIFDELPNEDNVDTSLRHVQAHDVDVVAVAYSHSLGLIATADCVDTLKVWNYEFMQIVTIIDDFTGSRIGTLKFVENYPLLLVGDIYNNFYLLPVGPGADSLGRKRWKVESVIYRKPDAHMHNLEVLEVEEESESESALEPEDGSDAGGDGEGAAVQEQADKPEPALKRQPSMSSDDDGDWDPAATDGEDEEEEKDPQKPLKKKAMKEYLTKVREPKCCEIIVQKSSFVLEAEQEEEEETNPDCHEDNRLLQLLGTKFTGNDDDDKDDDSYYTESSDSESENEIDLAKRTFYKSTSVPFPKKGVRVSVVCGYDDGHIAVIDLTPAMRRIGLSHLRKHEEVAHTKTYNPRRTARRVVKETESKLTTWKPDDCKNVVTCAGHLNAVWAGHSSAVTTLYAIKDNDSIDILTSGQDRAVYTWNLSCLLKGTLTRGRDWDKLFRPRWVPPYSSAFREMNRTADANVLNDALGLAQFMNRGVSASQPGGRHDRGGSKDMKEPRTNSKAVVTNVSIDGTRNSSVTYSQNGVSKVNDGNDGNDDTGGVGGTGGEDHHDASPAEDDEEVSPSRSRVIGQLSGKITYAQSAKDISAAAMLEKEASRASLEAQAAAKAEKKKKNKKKNMFHDGPDEAVVKSTEAVWLDELMGGSSGSHVEVGQALRMAQKKTEREQDGKRERNIKTKYDFELQQIDENDPNNWEIQSSNRQRALYGNLFAEKDKQGVVKDPMALFEAKLDNIAGGDFRAFAKSIREDRNEATRFINESVTLESGSMLREGSLTSGLAIGMKESVESLPGQHSLTIEVPTSPSRRGPTSAIEKEKLSPSKIERAAEGEKHRKMVADETYSPYKWENSLRTPLYASPYPEGEPKAAASSKTAEYHAVGTKNEHSPASSAGNLSPMSPMSPVKPTQAQLLAMQEREAVLAVKSQFEEKMRLTEKLSKTSNRILKKKTRAHAREKKQIEREEALSPADKVRLELRKKKEDALGRLRSMSPQRSPTPLNTRHSFANLVHEKSTTIDEVMDVTRKQKLAEERWVRKMKYAMEDSHEELVSAARSRSTRGSGGRNQGDGESSKTGAKNGALKEKLSQSRDERILLKKEFGPYKTKDLLNFLRCFQSLPPELIVEDDDAHSQSTLQISVSASQTESQKKGDGDGDGEGDDDMDDWDDESIASDYHMGDDDKYGEGEGEEKDDKEEEEEEEEEDEEVVRQRLEQAEREREEREREQLADAEKAAEAKHASAVVNTNVRLLKLISTGWMAVNKSFKTEMQKVLTKRTETGVLPRNVIISLSDALTFCCPYMQLPDRQLCLRMFVLKTPRTVEHTEATEKGLTRDQLRKLKAMFEFFDKDNSGGIDKYEIVEVLSKLAENKKKEVTSDKFNDDEDKGVDLTDAEALIASVTGHDEPELDFDSFVKMFKNLVE